MRFLTRTPRFLPVILGAVMLAVTSVSVKVPSLRFAAGDAALAQAAPAPAQGAQGTTAGRPLRVLFLGSEQAAAGTAQPPTHQASGFYQAVATTLARKGIQLTPVLSPAALSADRLNYYDA